MTANPPATRSAFESPFLTPFEQLNPGVRADIQALADDPAFDPGDYKSGAGRCFSRCRICHTSVAPNGLCGYCRGRVYVLRGQRTVQ